MEDKEEMANLTSINLTLSQILTQAQETILVLSKKLQALQVQKKTKTPATNRTSLDQKTRILNQSATSRIMGETEYCTIPAQPSIYPSQDTK